MSYKFRTLASMIASNYANNKGTFGIQVHLELMLPATQAAQYYRVFREWYVVSTKQPNAVPITLDSDLIKLPPLLVAGYLSDFARYVDEVVDTAITLSTASDLIKQYGWIQGTPGRYQEGYDLLGAVDAAVSALARANEAGYANRTHVTWDNSIAELRDFIGTAALAAWNDSPDRSQREVVATLDACATRVRVANT